MIRAISTGVVASMLLVPAVQAAEGETKSDPNTIVQASQAEGAEAIQGDDGGAWELGIEGSAANLTAATAAERLGMKYWLEPANNWVKKFEFNESSSYEEDFKRLDLGGNNNNYVDAVDLAFYVGHGSPNSFSFDNTAHDDRYLTYDDCERAWGDNDNEWVALTSCNVLQTNNDHQWAQCMNGSHLILGFHTTAYAHNDYRDTQSYWFGKYIMQNYTMTASWFKACDRAQRTRVVNVLGNELSCYNDRPNLNQVCADSYDTDWWYWTHSCGTETAIEVPLQQLAGVMPVFKVQPLSLSDVISKYETLGNVFSIPVSATIQSASVVADGPTDSFLTSEDNNRTLEIDKNSGQYGYLDLNNLWNADALSPTLSINAASPNYIDSSIAISIADNFLRANNLNGPGSVFFEVVSDKVSTQDSDPGDPGEPGDGSGGPGLNASAALSETDVVWQVIYSRRLQEQRVNAAGETETIEYSVVGPGAKQKVYVPVVADVNAASVLETAPVGVQAGWRPVEQQFVVNAAGVLEPLMVTVISTDTAKSLYLALGEDVSMADVPLDAKSREVISETVGYYEMAAGSSQAELIPVYEFGVRFTLQDDTTLDDFIDIPVNERYIRPIARINGIPSEGVNQGTIITLTAADASKTLKDLGIADFDLTLGSGDPDSLIYEWFVGDLDQQITTGISDLGKTLVYTVPTGEPGKSATVNIILRVTDNGNPNSMKSQTVGTIDVNPSVFLPLINR